MKYEEMLRTFTLFDQKIFKSKGEIRDKIIYLCVSKLMVIEFNRILAKGLQRIYNFLFLYLFIYLKLIFFHPTHDRTLNLHMSAFFSAQPA